MSSHSPEALACAAVLNAQDDLERARLFRGLLASLNKAPMPEMPPLVAVTGRVVECVIDRPPARGGDMPRSTK